MKILVTGGAGFIGSNFIRYILRNNQDIEVVNFDKLTYSGNPENINDLKGHPRYKFVRGDICNQKAVERVIKDTDIVFHFAAESHVDKSIKEPSIFTKTNLLGTHTLLEAARKEGIKKFLQISTDEVYGSINKRSFNEDSPLRPNSPYSSSKAGADLLARSYFVTYGLPVLITRSSNNFGPYQYPEKIIPLFITNLLENKKIPLYGDGLNVRDWIFVVDNCEAISFVAKKGKIGGVYNIGAGNELTNLQLTKLILKELEKTDSMIEFIQDRPGHDRRYSLDCRKILELGWSPKYSFKSAIKETIQWYIKNRSWWEKIKSGEYRKYYKSHYKATHQIIT